MTVNINAQAHAYLLMIPDRYSYGNFKRAIKQPSLFVKEVGRLPSTIHSVIQNGWASMNGLGKTDALKLTETDWDNLIIIDACRADLFEEVVNLGQFDQYKRVVSMGTNTTPWSIKNFYNEQLGDTVYVTGNPAPSKTVPDEFHEFIEVWTDQNKWISPGDGTETQDTLPPDAVADAALEANESYPNKRLVVHFIQPHAPFIEDPDLIYRSHWDPKRKQPKDPDPPNEVWDAVKLNKISRERAWEGYKRNLECVLPHVFNLFDSLPGKTILTSDHGNMIGEKTVLGKSIYGHPGGVRTPELVQVPWCVDSGEARKKIYDEGVRSRGAVNSDMVNERLAALGYVE